MNLIEQLGGYDRANKIANCKSGVAHPTKQLLDALLQHRRENNIFEVGDCALHPMFKSVFKIENVFKDHVIALNKSGYRTNLSTELIRHATPQEIKAGHRL